MATITLRDTKGSPLTHEEMDDNFSNLNTATVPAGGTAGQVLTKDSTTDYDTSWQTPSSDSTRTVVYAKADAAITKGQVVMFAGAQGDHILIVPADTTASGFRDEWVVGVAEETLSTGDFTYVVAFGSVAGLNTNAFNEGDLLWLSASTAGALTSTQPADPNHQILVAAVTRKSATVGSLLVRPEFGKDLTDLCDVNIPSTPSNGDVLTWDNANGYWEATAPATGITELVSDTTPQLGGDLDVNGQDIVSVSNGDITLQPNGTGILYLTNNVNVSSSQFSVGNMVSTFINSDLTVLPPSMGINNQALFNNFGISGIPTTYLQGVNEATVYVSALNSSGIPATELGLDPAGNATITALNNINLLTGAGNKVFVGNGANTAYVTSNGATNLLLQTNSGTNSGSIQLGAGLSGNVAITHGATGKVTVGNYFFGNTAIISSSGTQPLTLASDNSNIVIRGSGGSGDVDINATNNINLTPASFTNNIQGLFNNFGVSGIPAAYLQAANETVIYVSAYNSSSIPGAEIILDPTSSGSVTLGGANSGSIVLQNGSSGNVILTTGFGANYVKLNPQFGKVMVGNGSNTAVITTNGATNLTLQTNDGTNSGSITLGAGMAGDIALTHGLTGKVTVGNYFFGNTAIVSSSGSQALTLQTNSGNTTSIVMNSGPTGKLAITTPFAGSVTIGNQFFGNTAILSSSGTQPLTLASDNGNVIISGSGGSGDVDINATTNINITPGSMTNNFNALFNNFGVSGVPVSYFQGIPGATLYIDSFASGGYAPIAEIGLTDSGDINITAAATGGVGNTTITGIHTHITNARVGYKVYAIGNSGTSTLTPNATNGQVQTITATGNFTLSAFSSPVSGQHIKFIITQDATGSRTLTSTMKFEGASKTLSTAANSVDILDVWYIGSTYYASLTKGYA